MLLFGRSKKIEDTLDEVDGAHVETTFRTGTFFIQKLFCINRYNSFRQFVEVQIRLL